MFCAPNPTPSNNMHSQYKALSPKKKRKKEKAQFVILEQYWKRECIAFNYQLTGSFDHSHKDFSLI